jgi:hypothetical protein
VGVVALTRVVANHSFRGDPLADFLAHWTFPERSEHVPVGGNEVDADCGTYLQRAACDLRFDRSVDGPRPVRTSQRNLRSGQFDHRPRFGSFPGLAVDNCTAHEECRAGEDADIVFRIHRVMLL